jgi:hypothetical protein
MVIIGKKQGHTKRRDDFHGSSDIRRSGSHDDDASVFFDVERPGIEVIPESTGWHQLLERAPLRTPESIKARHTMHCSPQDVGYDKDEELRHRCVLSSQNGSVLAPMDQTDDEPEA